MHSEIVRTECSDMEPQLQVLHVDYSKLPVQWTRLIIDGDNGSGKSTLAKIMARDLGAKVVSLDEYLFKNGEIYWEQIDNEPLKSAILSGGSKVIIEGVCVLKLLEKNSITHDYHIFIKLFNGIFGWEYQQFLNERAQLPRSKLRREIAEYYRQYKPFDVCHLTLERFT
jgi:Fe-S cluster assembly ATPase SufC